MKDGYDWDEVAPGKTLLLRNLLTAPRATLQYIVGLVGRSRDRFKHKQCRIHYSTVRS